MKKIFSLFVIALFSVSMFADTWTVAGNNATILGVEWSTTDENNDMVQIGETDYWKLVKVFSALDAEGSVQYKVCMNHDWDPSYPAQNQWCYMPNGASSVLFTFNASTHSTFAFSHVTVSGGSEPLFGYSWGIHAENDMNYANDVYTFTKSGVALTAGSIEYRIVANHDNGWNAAWPNGNATLSIAEDGKYDVTITFNPYTYEVTANAEKKEDVVVVPTIKLHGNFTGVWVDTDEFEIDGNNETASLTLYDLQAGNYEFGVKKDGEWVSNGAEFTRNSASHEVVAGSGNLSIAVDQTGDYTFTWTYDSNTLTVTYPTPTALDNTADEAKAVKRIVNGQMVIEKAGVRYSVLGAEIK